MYIYICIYLYISLSIYIYISLSLYIYIYIYTYICLTRAFFKGGEECSTLWCALTRQTKHKNNEAVLDK